MYLGKSVTRALVYAKFAVTSLVWASLTACNSGGESGPSVVYEPDEITQELADKITSDGIGVLLNSGSPPARTVPARVTIIAPDLPLEVRAGNTISIPILVNSSIDLDTLFAKIPGARSYFSAELPSPDGKAAIAKNEHIVDFRVTIPLNFAPGGYICFEFSASNINGDVSSTVTTCLIIVGPTVTPAPTSTGTPTASPTVAPTSSPSATPTPTGTPTASPSATPSASPSATPTPTTTPTPTPPLAAECDDPISLSWAGTGTYLGDPVSISFTANRFDIDEPVPQDAFVLRITEGPTAGQSSINGYYAPGLIDPEIEGDDSSVQILYAGEFTGVGQYTAGAANSYCASGSIDGQSYYFEQTSATIQVTKFENCANDDKYIALTFTCQTASSLGNATIQGEFTGLYEEGVSGKSDLMQRVINAAAVPEAIKATSIHR